MSQLKLLFTIISLFLYLQSSALNVDSLLISIPLANDDSTKAILYNRAIYALIHNDNDRLLEVYAEGEAVLEKFPNVHAFALHGIGWAMIRIGNYEMVDTFLMRAKSISKDSSQIFGINVDIAHSYYNQASFVKAKEIILTNIANLERQQPTPNRTLSRVYNVLGLIYLEQGFAEKAKKTFETSIEYAEKADLKLDKSITYINLSLVMLRRGCFAKALNYSKNSIEMVAHPSASNLTNTDYYLTFAQIYNRLGLWEKGDHLLQKVASLNEQTKDSFYPISIQLEALEKQLIKKNVMESKLLVETLTKQLKNTKHLILLPYFKEKEITYNLLSKDTATALVKIDTLLQLALTEDMVYYEAKSYLFLSDIYSTSKPLKSIALSQKALAIADSLPNESLIAESYQQLAQLLERTQQFQKATFYHKKLSNLQDTVNLSIGSVEVLTILLAELEKSLEGTSVNPTKNSQRSNIYYWGVGLMILLLTTLLLLKIRVARKNQIVDKLSNSRSIQKENQSNLNIKLDPIEKKRRVESFQSLINNLSLGQIDWPQFLMEYEELFPEFLANFRNLPINHSSNTNGS